MIDLYNPGNNNFDKNGDITIFPISATVEVEINGAWSAEIEHPIDTEGRWKYIQEEAVVRLPSFNGKQLFRIKRKEKTETGVRATLTPIFFDAKDDCFLEDVRPTDRTGEEALRIMCSSNTKYAGKSDIKIRTTAYYEFKNLIEALFSDDENSFLKRWGGETLFDNFTVTINKRIGTDREIRVRYGKNIAENGISEETDTSSVITRIYPRGYNGRKMESKKYIDSPHINKYPNVKIAVMKFEDVKMLEDTNEDEENSIVCNTQEEFDKELEKKCQQQFELGVDKPKVEISINMVLLENTDVYKELKAVESVHLGDTVDCRHEKLDITTKARIIYLKYDCLTKRVVNVKIGQFQYNFLDNMSSTIQRVEESIRPDGTLKANQVYGIIDGIKAQMHIQSTKAKKTKEKAFLSEDLDEESETFGAMCWGSMGFMIADTKKQDGTWDWKTFGTGKGFFADLIVAGTMLADRIKGGILELGGAGNENGIFLMLDGNGKEQGKWDKDGIITTGRIKSDNKATKMAISLYDGRIYLYGENGETTGTISYLNDGVTMQTYGGSSIQSITLKKNGETDLSAKKIYLSTEQLISRGRVAKSGRAEFSDGSYLEFENGILVGGETKDGTKL